MSFFLAPRKTSKRWITCYYIGGGDTPVDRELGFMRQILNLNIRCFYVKSDVDTPSDAMKYDCVFVSETVSSATVGDTYRGFLKPVIAQESDIWDDMDWISASSTQPSDDEIGVVGQHPIIAQSGLNVGDYVITASASNKGGAASLVSGFEGKVLAHDAASPTIVLGIMYPNGILDNGSVTPSLCIANGMQQSHQLNAVGLALQGSIWNWIADWIRSEVYGDRI